MEITSKIPPCPRLKQQPTNHERTPHLAAVSNLISTHILSYLKNSPYFEPEKNSAHVHTVAQRNLGVFRAIEQLLPWRKNSKDSPRGDAVRREHVARTWRWYSRAEGMATTMTRMRESAGRCGRVVCVGAKRGRPLWSGTWCAARDIRYNTLRL